MTWGSASNGGDSSSVQQQLRDVRAICATSAAFAAVLADGSVVTWGDKECGGDSSEVAHELREKGLAALAPGFIKALCACFVHVQRSWSKISKNLLVSGSAAARDASGINPDSSSRDEHKHPTHAFNP